MNSLLAKLVKFSEQSHDVKNSQFLDQKVQSDSLIIINPQLDSSTREQLNEVFLECSSKFDFPTLWVASSGTSISSGTTPKLYCHTFETLISSAASVCRHFELSEKDHFGVTLPLWHVGGLGLFFRARFCSSKLSIYDQPWNPNHFLKWLTDNMITVFSLVPTQLFDLVKEKLQCPCNAKVVFLGGDRLDSRLKLQAKELGWPVVETYGMTEMGSMIGVRKENDYQSLPHVQVSISEESFLKFSGPSMIKGFGQYVNGQLIWSSFENQSCLQSEDVGELVNPNSFKVLGRVNDFVKINGEGINLNHVHESVCQFLRSDLSDSEVLNKIRFVVRAMDDERKGKRLGLFVEGDLVGLPTPAVQQKISKLVERYNQQCMPLARIQNIQFENLKRNSMGKVIRT